MKRIIGIRTLKTGLGATITLILANSIGLKYATAAAVITILSIQSTKKQSVQMAINRLIATLIALGLSSVVFLGIGFNPLAFGLFLIIFIPIAAELNIGEGIVPASVLVTHLLTEQVVTWALLFNELMLLLIGVMIALLINLYMPSIESELRICRRQIEGTMYKLFHNMAYALRMQSTTIQEDDLYKKLEVAVKEGQEKAYKYTNNYLFTKASPFDRYFNMRDNQLQVMLYMREHFTKFFMCFEETEIVAAFTEKVADSIRGKITAKALLEELGRLRNDFKSSNLPTTREEFENRAMLYQFLNDIEHFLKIKEDFRESLTEAEFEHYKKGYTS